MVYINAGIANLCDAVQWHALSQPPARLKCLIARGNPVAGVDSARPAIGRNRRIAGAAGGDAP